MIPVLATPVVEVTISAAAVAWYGAIVATLSVALSLYLALRDRACVEVTARPNFQIAGEHPPKLYIIANVSNRGRRPVSIWAVALVQVAEGKTTEIAFAESLHRGAVELTEGKGVSYKFDQEGLDLSTIRSVVAYDQTRRKWKGRFTAPRKTRASSSG